MDNNDAPSPLLLFQTLTAYQRSNALKAGIDLGLFSAIGSNASTAAELAAIIGAAERGVRILCDYLTIAGFLIKEGALSRQLKEYVFLVCSAANLSTYCVTAHCEIIRMLKLSGPEPEQIALDHMSTDLAIVDKALLNFSLKLNNHPLKITQEDIDDLKTYGFNDQQILEAVMCVGLAKWANFIGFGLGTVPDYEVRLDLEKSKAVAV